MDKAQDSVGPQATTYHRPSSLAAAMKNTQFFAQNLLRTGLFLGLDGPRCLV